jgi:DNA mismatch repair protein MutS2
MIEGPAVKDTSESHELKLQIKTGDWVRIKGQERAGKVIRIKADDVIVDYEGIHFTVASSKIEPAEKPDDPGRPVRSSISMPGDITLRAANFRLTLDLRGKTTEDALAVVRKYLDDALLVGISEVSILHGKGDGILRTAIRRMLAESENVAGYEDEPAERGGSGITKVRLK